MLSSYHDRVLEKVVAVEAALARPPAEAIPILSHLRWEMARLLRECQLFKHREIFDPGIALPSCRHATRAGEAKRRCQAASKRYEAHVRRWSMVDIAGRWDEYRSDTAAIALGIRTHIDGEFREADAILGAAEIDAVAARA